MCFVHNSGQEVYEFIKLLTKLRLQVTQFDTE